MLMASGVEPVEAQRYVLNVVKSKSGAENPVEFFEVYGQGGLRRTASRLPSLNVVGLEVMDFRSLRPDGQPWDFFPAKRQSMGS